MKEFLNLKTNQEMGNFKAVDRKSQEVLDGLKNAPIYKKFGKVKVRPGVAGEEIVTRIAGQEETRNTVKEGDYVMTNPGGEEYILGSEKLASRYQKTDEDGVYEAKGFCRAIPNPFGYPVEIMASWGSPQAGDKDCYFADTCDEDGNMSGEPYIIESQAFADTYALYEKEQLA